MAALPLSHSAFVGNRQASASSIQAVGKDATVLTQDEQAVPLKEVGFGTLEEKVLCEIAAEFDTYAGCETCPPRQDMIFFRPAASHSA